MSDIGKPLNPRKLPFYGMEESFVCRHQRSAVFIRDRQITRVIGGKAVCFREIEDFPVEMRNILKVKTEAFESIDSSAYYIFGHSSPFLCDEQPVHNLVFHERGRSENYFAAHESFQQAQRLPAMLLIGKKPF